MKKPSQSSIHPIIPPPSNRGPTAAPASGPRSDNSILVSSSSWSAISLPSMPGLSGSYISRLPPPPPTPPPESTSTYATVRPAAPTPAFNSLQTPTDINRAVDASSAQTKPLAPRRKPRRKQDSSNPNPSQHTSPRASTSSKGEDLINSRQRQFIVPYPPGRTAAFRAHPAVEALMEQASTHPLSPPANPPPEYQAYPTSPLRIRRPSPTPQSLSSASSRSSVSYVSLKSGMKLARISKGDGRRLSKGILDQFPRSLSPEVIHTDHEVLAHGAMDDYEELDYDPTASLLLPEERDRVHLWAAQVVAWEAPPEDEILADDETPVRSLGDNGMGTSSSGPTPGPQEVTIPAPGPVDLATPFEALPIDPRWVVDNVAKKWIWCGPDVMPPLPQYAIRAGFQGEHLDLGFNHPSSVPTAALAGLKPPRPPIIETPMSYPTPNSTVPSAYSQQSISPKPARAGNKQANIPNAHEFLPLISPSPFSQLPSPMRPRPPIPPTPVPDPCPTPSVNSYQDQGFFDSLSPHREPSPEVPGRLAISSNQGSTVRSAGSKSTLSARGRSPTRRSWKATSERSRMSRPYTITPPRNLNEGLDHDATGLTDMSVSLGRPRTASRSSGGRPSTYTPAPIEDLTQTPSVSSSQLFFRPHRRTPFAPNNRPTEAALNASVGPPPTIVSIPPQPSPTPDRTPAGPTGSAPIASALPLHFRRRSIPATVVSLSGSLATSTEPMSDPPTTELIATQDQATHSKTSRPNTLLNEARPSHHTSEPEKVAPPSTSGPRLPNSDAFLRLITRINGFTSELSSDKRGVPRWKSENVDLAEKVREAYYELCEQVGGTRMRFRPWMSSWKEAMLDEPILIDAMDGDRTKASGPVMYLDDMVEELEGPMEMKRRSTPEDVQERIMKSIAMQWKKLIVVCLGEVHNLLQVYVHSVIDSHFSGFATQELQELVGGVVNGELKALYEDTTRRVEDIVHLESSNMFSVSVNRFGTSQLLLSRYKALRQRAYRSIMMRNQSKPSQPIAIDRSAHGFQPGHSRSHSGTGTNSTQAAAPSRSIGQSPPNVNSNALARLRRFSLLGNGSDSMEYLRDMKLAMSGLSNLGFKDISPDKLYDLMSENDPTDHFVNQLGPRVNEVLLRSLGFTDNDVTERFTRWMI